ncbi:MAG: efflux RND transporter periplasmic adaptor subunit [Betaproteobacteria bacterium]|nr:efflux RND transporter periplasmic adaptor subunit [Betaproteobacteria bacterium]
MQDLMISQRGVLRWRFLWLSIFCLALLAGGGTWVKLRGGKDATAAQKPVITLEFSPSDIAIAQKRELQQVLPLTGNLQAFNQTLVRAKVAGEIKQTLVREGEAVRREQVLARFDTMDFQSRLNEKIANLEGARAQLSLAEKNLQNSQFLLQQKFISQNAYDSSQSNLLVGQANLKSCQAQVDLARNALNDAVVRAPMDGFVAKRHVQPGEKVSQDMPLFSIVDLSRMELQAPIPASEIGNVKLGQEATIRIEGNSGKAYSGRVERINPAAEAGSRSIMIYIAINNAERTLRGGMFATGLLNLSKTPPVLAIPVSALRSENGRNYVITLEAGKLAKHFVEIGQTAEQDGLVGISSGLAESAQVVTSRMDGLKPGSPAMIKSESGKPAGAETAKG